jgi:hypothetical protein
MVGQWQRGGVRLAVEVPAVEVVQAQLETASVHWPGSAPTYLLEATDQERSRTMTEAAARVRELNLYRRYFCT